MDPLLTPLEVAEMLKVAEQTLRQWRWKNRGPRFTRIGGQVRYRLSAVEAYIAAGEDVEKA